MWNKLKFFQELKVQFRSKYQNSEGGIVYKKIILPTEVWTTDPQILRPFIDLPMSPLSLLLTVLFFQSSILQESDQIQQKIWLIFQKREGFVSFFKYGRHWPFLY